MHWSARLGVVCAAMAIVAPAAPAASAFGGDVDVDFEAKVNPFLNRDEAKYYGRVRSNVEECSVGRKVRITVKRHLIARAETDEKGKFGGVAESVEEGSSVKFKLKPNRPSDCPGQTLFVQV